MEEPNAGAAWVDRYLTPLLSAHFGRRSLVCLQIEPTSGESEAIHLRSRGHVCELMLCNPARYVGCDWERPPVAVDPLALPFRAGCCDFVFCGALARVALGPRQRAEAAREMARVCRPGGALLLTIGNRVCPVDLSHNSSLLHHPFDPALATWSELQRDFLGAAAFTRIRPLGLAGNFGWRGIPSSARRLLESYLGWCTAPHRPRVYASPLNPMLAVWLER